MKITITVEPIAAEGYTEAELRQAICELFQTGGEVWVTMKDGKEIAFIAQDAE
jgi:hypothetical protein